MAADDATVARPALPVRLARYARRDLRPAADRLRAQTRRARLDDGVHPEPDEARSLDHQWYWSACYAPMASMYLDQFGDVRACCQNTGHLLGSVTRSTLREIWEGAQAAELRGALRRGDLGHGCEFCAWQVTEAGPAGAFLQAYDGMEPGWREAPRWPRQLEFSVTNTCNLQCAMCNGDWSSTIRAKREHRDPLPSAYPERFYEELEAFIPHLVEAKFTGGEPFLGDEPLRIMDLLLRLGRPELTLTMVTNGTVATERVERVVSARPTWLVVSFDGGTEEVYERVRVGARFDRVLRNIDHLGNLARASGGGLSLTHCLMTDNWQTFPELLALAEERNLDVAVNTVRFPEDHSLYHLPPAALDEVVAGLTARSPEVERTITGERLALWHQQLAALQSRAVGDAWPAALGVPPEDGQLATSVAVQITARTGAGQGSEPQEAS